MRGFLLSRIHLPSKVARLAALAVVSGVTLAPSAASQTAPTAPAVSTPRVPGGQPDLTGMWDGRGATGGSAEFAVQIPRSRLEKVEDDGDIVRLGASRRCAPNQQGCRDNTNQSNDLELTGRMETNKPIYRPEHWDRVQFLDYDTNFSDPMFECLPLGIPRSGPPRKIVQLPTEVIFFYGAATSTSNDNHYRIIPINGRKHNPDAFPTFHGDSIGWWEGDTLVVEAVSFNDQTWLTGFAAGPRGGFFHSFELRVVERFRREGDVLHYAVTVEDPAVLLHPWVMTPRQLRLNPDPNATINEALPCRSYDQEITVSRIRH